MVIRALDIVRRCYSQDDGQKIYDVLCPRLTRGERIELSFDGVDTVPSSFINTSLIKLLDVVSFDTIKTNLRFVNTTKQINEMIKSRFDFEVNRRHLGTSK
ncbi:STAS-like domain-containing protein [Massilia sp. H6]|uniref:STAS-like domain-containing protein n=1 Tax=Massilia sp. H6 TaxID=2970464 RepID=UPI0035A3ACE7